MAAGDKLARGAYKLGSWLFVGIFVGHTAGQLTTDFGTPTAKRKAVYDAMATTFGMDGSMRTLRDFARGDSYGMGVLYLAVGALLLLAARSFDQRDLPYPRPIIGIGFLTALASLLLSVRFFPLPPAIFMSVATVAFAIAYVRTPA
jgi:hypothetical protein